MATTVPGFPAQEFIDGIHTAMSLGLPVDPADRAVFVTPGAVTTPSVADAGGLGFDLTVGVDKADDVRVQVPYALEYADANGVVLESADIVPSVIVLTMLGPDFDQVRGFEYIELGSGEAMERWFYWKTAPEMAMDSVPVWQVYLKAEDDA